MPPRWKQAFEAIFPVAVYPLAGAFVVMLVLLFNLPWYVTLPLILMMILLLSYVGWLLIQEYKQQQIDNPPVDVFVPLEPLERRDTGE